MMTTSVTSTNPTKIAMLSAGEPTWVASVGMREVMSQCSFTPSRRAPMASASGSSSRLAQRA